MLRPQSRAFAVVCLVVVTAVAAGCGADAEPGEDTGAVRAVVTRFGAATRAGDYQTICDELLSQNLVAKLEAIGLPCEIALQKGFGDVRDPRLEVRDVAVSGGRALVSVHSTAAGQAPSDDAMQLVRENGEWRIASLASKGDPGTSTSASTTATTATTSTSPPRSRTTPTTTTSAPGNND